MNLIPFNPYIGFPKPHPLFIVVLLSATIAVSLSPLFRGQYRRLIGFFTLFLISYLYLTYAQGTPNHLSTLACNKGKVSIIHDNNKIAVIDPGYIGQRKSAFSWLAYTLLPFITQTTGKTIINHLILLKPTKTTLTAAVSFISEYKVEELYSPLLEQKFSIELDALKRICQKNNCRLIEISNKPVVINLGSTILTVKPENRSPQQKALGFDPLSVTYKNSHGSHDILPIKHTQQIRFTSSCIKLYKPINKLEL